MESNVFGAKSGVRWQASAASLACVLSVGVGSVGLFQVSGSWLATLLGLTAVGGALGAWIGQRLQRQLAGVEALAETASGVSQGHFPEPVDEAALGPLARAGAALNALLAGLASTSSNLLERMQGISAAPRRISDMLSEIRRAADAQEEAVEETASLLANINSSIQVIDERIVDLTSAAEESSSSILEMGTSVEEVARNTDVLHESFESSTSAVHQMSASIRQVAEGASTVERMAEESASSMHEMDRTIQEVSAHVQEASSLTGTVSQGAQEGADAVSATIRDIERIHRLTSDTKQGLGQLVSSIGEISQIMNVIGDINDETNLLSLNAAIIAAQAGEQGKPFLVVANHVKVLAGRTATSTKDIERLIRQVKSESDSAVESMEAGIEAIEQGVRRSRDAGEALSAIRGSAADANSRVGEIARATEQQSQNSKHVAHAVQQTSTQIRQISEAMSEQTKVSERMLVTSQTALEMCQHVHRSTNEQRETGRYITSSISTITDMIQRIQESISEHRRASEAVSEAVMRLLDNARGSGQQVPELNELLVDLHEGAAMVVNELARLSPDAPSTPADEA